MNGDPRVWDPSRGVKTRPWGEGYSGELVGVQVGRVLPFQPWAISGRSTFVLLMRCNVVKPEIAPSYRSDFQTAITPHDSPPSTQAGAWRPRGEQDQTAARFSISPRAGSGLLGGRISEKL
jgi:hypothetical protein